MIKGDAKRDAIDMASLFDTLNHQAFPNLWFTEISG